MRETGTPSRRWILDQRADLCAVSVIATLSVLLTIFLWHYDSYLRWEDRVTQFIPWFAYLGERLRNGDIPAWSFSEASGEPFIGNPTSGWLNLPVMALFAAFPPLSAYKLYLLFQMWISGFGAYAFARRIGLVPVAALVSALALMTGPVFFHTVYWGAAASILLIHVPLALLAVEQAYRADRWSSRLGWCALFGFALAQFVIGSLPRVIWAVAIVFCWMLYRTFVEPVPNAPALRNRIGQSLLIGTAGASLGIGWAAGTLLPQLSFIQQSPLRGADYGNLIGADYAEETWPRSVMMFNVTNMLDPRFLDTLIVPGVLFLGILGLLAWGTRYGAIVWAFIILVAIDFGLTHSVSRSLLWLIPPIEQNTSHRPTASTIMLGIAAPLLAGCGVHWLLTHQRWSASRRHAAWLPLAGTGAAVLILGIYLTDTSRGFSPWQWLAWGLMALLVAGVIVLRTNTTFGTYRTDGLQLLGGLILATALFFPLGMNIVDALAERTDDPWNFPRFAHDPALDNALEVIFGDVEDGTAEDYILDQQENRQPFRFTPYMGKTDEFFYLDTTFRSYTLAVMANSRPIMLGLQYPSGYNPLHLAHYVDYINVMNGRLQDYHFVELFPEAMTDNQLMNMLNIKYIAVYPPDNVDFSAKQYGEVVFEGPNVAIYKNPDAFPRAWVVHDVRSDVDGTALEQLRSNAVDGRVTAFVAGDAPRFSALPDPTGHDSAVVTSYEPERIQLEVEANGDGLLVLSEIYADGWNAYVDGEKVDIVRTNHALRGVPLSDGQHTVVVKYEPCALTVGMWATGGTSLVMIALWAWAAVDGRRVRQKRKTVSKEDDLEAEISLVTGLAMLSELRVWLRRHSTPRRVECLNGGLLTILCGVLLLSLYRDGKRLSGQDLSVFYLPMWHYLGDRLASFEVPSWNPYQYGGAPFAGDPESGWMYVPSMLLYAVFGVMAATTLWTLLHLILTSGSTYILARLLGMGPWGSLFAGAASVTSTWYYRHLVSAPAYIQAGSWIPPTLVAVELAGRTRRMSHRLFWSGIAAFCFSQIVAAWLGKGAYYAMFLVGGYAIYRLLTAEDRPWSIRIRDLGTIGVTSALCTVLLTIGGLVPRLAFHNVSNLQDGYQAEFANYGWYGFRETVARILGIFPDSPTVFVAVLGMVGAVVAGRRYTAPYFVAVIVGATLLSVRETDWIRVPFNILPQFETIHNHYPFQITMIMMLPFALLAGAAVEVLHQQLASPSRMIGGLATALFIVWWSAFPVDSLTRWEIAAIMALIAVVAILAQQDLGVDLRVTAAVGLVLLQVGPFLQRTEQIGTTLAGGVMYADLDQYYEPAGAVAFIREQEQLAGMPLRYFGYDPAYVVRLGPYDILYRRQFNDSRVTALEVNNRATMHGLHDIQGQNNPIQLEVIEGIFYRINGFELEYHEAAVFPPGLDSPYLDLLNVRFIIIPTVFNMEREDLTSLCAQLPTVYQDDKVRVLDRGTNLGPAFWAPSILPVTSESDAQRLIGDGIVDPRMVAPVVGEPNVTEPVPVLTSGDKITLLAYEPEKISVQATTTAPRLLVFSELVYPDWRAYVDGHEVEVFSAYGGLRSVVVPTGAHDVELRFKSNLNMASTVVSGGAHLVLAACVVLYGWHELQAHRRHRALTTLRVTEVDLRRDEVVLEDGGSSRQVR